MQTRMRKSRSWGLLDIESLHRSPKKNENQSPVKTPPTIIGTTSPNKLNSKKEIISLINELTPDDSKGVQNYQVKFSTLKKLMLRDDDDRSVSKRDIFQFIVVRASMYRRNKIIVLRCVELITPYLKKDILKHSQTLALFTYFLNLDLDKKFNNAQLQRQIQELRNLVQRRVGKLNRNQRGLFNKWLIFYNENPKSVVNTSSKDKLPSKYVNELSSRDSAQTVDLSMASTPPTLRSSIDTNFSDLSTNSMTQTRNTMISHRLMHRLMTLANTNSSSGRLSWRSLSSYKSTGSRQSTKSPIFHIAITPPKNHEEKSDSKSDISSVLSAHGTFFHRFQPKPIKIERVSTTMSYINSIHKRLYAADSDSDDEEDEDLYNVESPLLKPNDINLEGFDATLDNVMNPTLTIQEEEHYVTQLCDMLYGIYSFDSHKSIKDTYLIWMELIESENVDVQRRAIMIMDQLTLRLLQCYIKSSAIGRKYSLEDTCTLLFSGFGMMAELIYLQDLTNITMWDQLAQFYTDYMARDYPTLVSPRILLKMLNLFSSDPERSRLLIRAMMDHFYSSSGSNVTDPLKSFEPDEMLLQIKEFGGIYPIIDIYLNTFSEETRSNLFLIIFDYIVSEKLHQYPPDLISLLYLFYESELYLYCTHFFQVHDPVEIQNTLSFYIDIWPEKRDLLSSFFEHLEKLCLQYRQIHPSVIEEHDGEQKLLLKTAARWLRSANMDEQCRRQGESIMFDALRLVVNKRDANVSHNRLKKCILLQIRSLHKDIDAQLSIVRIVWRCFHDILVTYHTYERSKDRESRSSFSSSFDFDMLNQILLLILRQPTVPMLFLMYNMFVDVLLLIQADHVSIHTKFSKLKKLYRPTGRHRPISPHFHTPPRKHRGKAKVTNRFISPEISVDGGYDHFNLSFLLGDASFDRILLHEVHISVLLQLFEHLQKAMDTKGDCSESMEMHMQYCNSILFMLLLEKCKNRDSLDSIGGVHFFLNHHKFPSNAAVAFLASSCLIEMLKGTNDFTDTSKEKTIDNLRELVRNQLQTTDPNMCLNPYLQIMCKLRHDEDTPS